MADVEAGRVEAEDVTMVQSTTLTTKSTPAPSATGTAMAAVTVIESKNGMQIGIGH